LEYDLPTAFKGLEAIKTPASLKDMALQSIKDAIWSDILHPGIIYSEPQLAQELKISRTPVREALLELAGNGFLTFIPRRGFKINQLSLKEVHHLFSFRRTIELAVLSEVIPIINDGEIEDIVDIHNRDIAATHDTSLQTFVQIDREFHTFLAELTENQYLIAAQENARDLIDWVGTKILKRPERSQEAVREHGAIVDAIREKDLAQALQCMERHINITEKLITDHIGRELEAKKGEAAGE